ADGLLTDAGSIPAGSTKQQVANKKGHPDGVALFLCRFAAATRFTQHAARKDQKRTYHRVH
ncbi:hypothetical protein, partial [uncultured Alcanivorax sp.]|uniref:hypothetical protein n=1 Tax=uncultured Alcanivorax sp. TaxID=191215 RepID=UPI00262398B1